jgi:hypothetical protein
VDALQRQVPNPGINLFERNCNVSDRRQVSVLHQKLRCCFPKNSLGSNTEALRILDLVEPLDQDVLCLCVLVLTITSAFANSSIPLDLLPDPPDASTKLEAWHFCAGHFNAPFLAGRPQRIEVSDKCVGGSIEVPAG